MFPGSAIRATYVRTKNRPVGCGIHCCNSRCRAQTTSQVSDALMRMVVSDRDPEGRVRGKIRDRMFRCRSECRRSRRFRLSRHIGRVCGHCRCVLCLWLRLWTMSEAKRYWLRPMSILRDRRKRDIHCRSCRHCRSRMRKNQCLVRIECRRRV